MFKLTAIVILALAVCIVADPIRQKTLRGRVLARQQVLPTSAPTGYPAAGVTPEIPFDLPTETENPNAVLPGIPTQQPDEVYGPPGVDAQQSVDLEIEPDQFYGPPEAEVQQLDEVYGPPETETDAIPAIIEEFEEVPEEEVIIDEQDGAVISVSSTFEKPARLVYQRFPQSRRPPKAIPARLTIVKPANLVYTSSFQNFQRTI